MKTRKILEAGKVAARVGDEVITLHELTVAVQERFKKFPAGQARSKQLVNMVAASVLSDLIDRSLLYQEARHDLKDPKHLNMALEMADKCWREEELNPLIRKSLVTNEYELREKLAKESQSLDDMREAFRREFLAHGYMKSKLGAKLTVSLPEMRDYYNEHLKDFDRPALISWHEIVVEVDKCRSRTEARTKAEAVLARLRRGEDFAKVAQVESHGPNRKQGGVWETSPGGYGVAAVNGALEKLPIGELSPVIEGPSSFHVLRVDMRRSAGPASFAEADIQEKIRREIYNKKVHRETSGFLDKLRAQTVITTMFDGTESDPAAAPTRPAP